MSRALAEQMVIEDLDNRKLVRRVMDLNVVAMLAWSEVMETGVMDVVVGQLPGSEDQLCVRVGEEGGEECSALPAST